MLVLEPTRAAIRPTGVGKWSTVRLLVGRSFLSVWACSSARTSPVRQFLALSHKTYWLPIPAMEPSRTPELPVRSQISRAISGVSRVSGGRFIRRTAC